MRIQAFIRTAEVSASKQPGFEPSRVGTSEHFSDLKHAETFSFKMFQDFPMSDSDNVISTFEQTCKFESPLIG